LVGGCPSTVFRDSICGGSTAEMNLGANCEPTCLSPLKIPPPVKIVPAARRTPGTWRTRLSTPAGKLVVVFVSWVTGCSLVITTEVPFNESRKMSSKALLMVSVITYVPATRETPTNTAMTVPSARSLRAQRLLTATLTKLLHQLDDLAG